jgi:outer membrane protein OmpA-like peptidoglycan-associated protein
VRSFFAVVVSAAALVLFLNACGHGQSNTEASPAPGASADASEASPEASDEATSEASGESSPEAPTETSPGASPASGAEGSGSAVPGGESTAATTPIPVPTATPNPNLLSVANGTILRSYSPAVLDDMSDGSLRDAAYGIGSELPASAKPPYVFTFELAGVATITEFDANLRLDSENVLPATLKVEVSTAGPDSGFADVGTLTATTKTLTSNVKARWVRVTGNKLFNSVTATGTLPPPPASPNVTGIFVEQDDPDKNGSFIPTGTKEGYTRARFTKVGSALVATECPPDRVRAVFVGHLQDRMWVATQAGNKDANPSTFRGNINDEGTVFAGSNADGSGSLYFTRTTEVPAFCIPRVNGTGTHRVLVLDIDPIQPFYPTDVAPPLPGYRFEAIGAGMLDESMLAGKEAVVVRDICKVPEIMADEQRALLLKWVAAGHKLILGGGKCYQGSDFTWLPYPFTSAGPGPETDHASLIQLENSGLGTNDKNDAAHFVDVAAFVKDANNALGSAAVVTTTDSHWCGHFFVAKPTNLNGFVQMYAVDGNGSIIYDGINEDGDPVFERIRQLELALPVGASLPCTQHVTDSFLLEPNQEATFVAGKAQTVNVPMEILANQGWSGHVTVKTTGDLPARVSPSGFDIAGGTENIIVGVQIPASAKAGLYTVNAIASNGSGKTAQASVTLTGTAPLAKQFAPTQKRIRIYGIHFDVDSAVIQPRSEPVIAEIAGILKSNPGLRFQVEGHTDSDGGADYNLGLSQRRAQAVVDDLVKRYGIARGRLIAKGFGLTKPVASNATAAGKALNRRVELLRL